MDYTSAYSDVGNLIADLPEELDPLLQGDDEGPKEFKNPAEESVNSSLAAALVSLILAWAGEVPTCSRCESVCTIFANGRRNCFCRRCDPGTSLPTEAAHVQHPATSRVTLQAFNSSEKVKEYLSNPVTSPKKGDPFSNFKGARQALRNELAVPKEPLSFQNCIENNNAGNTKAKSPSNTTNKKRKNDEGEGENPKSKRPKITLRGVLSNLLLPATIRLLYGAIGYTKKSKQDVDDTVEPKEFTAKDIDDMVAKVLKDGEKPDSIIKFHLFGNETEENRDKALVFWAARFLLDCIEASEVFGLLDALINVLLTAKEFDNVEFVEVLAALGFQVSLCSRLVAIKAQEKSVGKQLSSSLMITSDRTPTNLIFLGVKVQLMKDLLRLLSRTGFFPSTSFTPAAQQYSNEFIELFGPEDLVDKMILRAYLILMCQFCDVRNRDGIADSLFCSCWSDHGNKSLVLPVFHAAWFGMVMKMHVWGETRDSIFQYPLARATGTTDMIKFVKGYDRNGTAKLRWATGYDNFELLVLKGVETGLLLVGGNFLNSEFDFCGDFATGRTICDQNKIFSLNISPSGDILFGGRTPTETATMLTSGLRRVFQYQSNYPNIIEMISRQFRQNNAVANLPVDMELLKTYEDAVELCAVEYSNQAENTNEAEISEIGAEQCVDEECSSECGDLLTLAEVSCKACFQEIDRFVEGLDDDSAILQSIATRGE